MDKPLDPIVAKSQKRRRAAWFGGPFLLIIAGLALYQTPPVSKLGPILFQLSPAPRIGNRILDFSLPATTGENVSTAQFDGKVLIVNFWATWCLPCREEMPTLQKIYDEHREHGFMLLGVNYGEDLDAVAKYARELQVSFPLLLDRDATVGQRYRVQGLPTTIFADRRGIIRDMVLGGPMSESYIESKIKPLLDEK